MIFSARRRYEEPEIGTDWRLLDGVATAWFDASSLVEGDALAGRIVVLSAEIVADLRATGVRVRLDSAEHSEAVSSTARDLGLAANAAVLQRLGVVFESPNPSEVVRFWQRVLDYAPAEDGGLTDPLRRDPALRLRQATEPRPSRNRIHLDVARPAAQQRRWPRTGLPAAGHRRASPRPSPPVAGCWTSRRARRVADPEGNELVIVSGPELAFV